MIDTNKYLNALRGVSQCGGLVAIDAAVVCIDLAVGDQDTATTNYYRAELGRLQDATETEIRALRTDAVDSANILRDQIAGLHRDNANLADTITNGKAENARQYDELCTLREKTHELDAVIDAKNATINALFAQLEAANASPGAFGGKPEAVQP